jgi:hypothetical protein
MLRPADASVKTATLTRNTNNKTTNKMGLDMYLSRVTRETKVYWRKANAIHNYIESKHADEVYGTPIELDRDAVKELRDHCTAVLNDHSLAPELLPTTSGFFFGSTEYDDDYFEELERTSKELNELLRDKTWDYLEYQASW